MTCICCNGETKRRGSFRNKNRIVQRYQCLRCGKSFSEKQPLDGLRTDYEKVVQIVKLLCEGARVRAAARLTGCQHKTVLAVLNAVGGQCAALHDRLVHHVTTAQLQLDELWSRVGISQRRTTESDVERGDQYTYLAITAREKFIVSFHTGKRDLDNTDIFVEDVAKRIVGRIQVTTDSFRPYLQIVRKHLLERLDFATMQKIYAAPVDAKSEAWRRYSPPQCTGVKNHVKGMLTPRGTESARHSWSGPTCLSGILTNALSGLVWAGHAN